MMIQTMILCLGKGRNDPKDLEGVLPVLDRRLDDGGDGGVVLHAGLGAEASADLEFGLGRPERFLTVVVRRRDIRLSQEDLGLNLVEGFHVGEQSPGTPIISQVAVPEVLPAFGGSRMYSDCHHILVGISE